MQHPILEGTDLQRQTLRLYGELMARREIWAGKLVFAFGEGASATGLPAAVSIAGGTTLALDPDAATVKAVFRKGGVDFVVNTLDEALRVLKNEIRKQRPLSVGLTAEVQPTLAQMVDRGVLPDLQVSIDAALHDPAEVGELLQAGMERLLLATKEGIAEPSERLSAWLGERSWEEIAMEAASPVKLRELDARLLALMPASDGVRRTWLERIGHYQRAATEPARVAWLTSAERFQWGER